MSLFAYLTPACRAAAQRHGLAPDVDALAHKIEREQQNLPRRLGHNFECKELGKDYRLVAYLEPVDGHEILVLAAVFRQEGRQGDYHDFYTACHDWEAAMTLLPGDQPTRPDLSRWLADRLHTDPPEPLPAPSGTEHDFLYSTFSPQSEFDDQMIYETERWVEACQANDWKSRLYSLSRVVADALVRQDQTPPWTPKTYWSEAQGLGVVYVWEARDILLIEPIKHVDDATAAAGRFLADFNPKNDPALVVDWKQLAYRAYPAYFALDADTWEVVQADPAANYALSSEEMDLLRGLRKSDPERDGRREVTFPLFINGRAGSGKSLMLQYVATDMIWWCLRNDATGLRPLYTACSADLMRKAKDVVRGQLRHGHRYEVGRAGVAAAAGSLDDVLADSFVVFHEYARSLVPDAAVRFATDKRVTFAKFKRLYVEHFSKTGRRAPRVELAWHVIRLIVKGRSSDPWPRPELYARLPRWCQASVSQDEYATVCDDVYEKWYHKAAKKDGWWDEQDLIAELLSGDRDWAGRHAAVLCDEAQDFTPIEFEFLLQLSLYSRRSVNPEDLTFVPFVFAGDPLQTLNPTGFQWSVVSTVFFEQYRTVIAHNPNRQAHKPRLHELQFNYRSNPGIARFCNSIQLLRAARLGDHDLRPQKAWKVNPPSAVVWLDVNNEATKARLAGLRDAVKIVDCHDGEETAHADADPWLRDITSRTENVYHNVLSPARAKGLEFDTVIIYKFGAKAPRGATELAGGAADASRLDVEYFLNRLYVAASRAKLQLVIVDAKDAVDGFWRFARDEAELRVYMAAAGQQADWDGALGYLVDQDAANWDGGAVDPLTQALEYQKTARVSRDSYLMKQAGISFRSAGKESDARLCFAEAAEFDDRHTDAAAIYEAENRPDAALQCFWAARDFAGVERVAATRPALTQDLRAKAAHAVSLATPPDLFLDLLVKKAADPVWCRDARGDATWRHVLAQLFDKLAADPAPGRSWGSCDAVGRQVHELIVGLSDRTLGTLAAAAGDHRRAVDHWDRAEWKDHAGYFRARAVVDPFPRAVVWLHRLGEHAAAVRRWAADGDAAGPAAKDVLGAIFESAVHIGDVELAADMADRLGEIGPLRQAYWLAIQHEAAATFARLSERIVRHLTAAGDWKSAVSATATGEAADVPKRLLSKRRILMATPGLTDRLTAALIRDLAASDLLARDSATRQAVVSDYLKQFIDQTADAKYPPGVTWQLVGAALERAGRLSACITFYGGYANSRDLPRSQSLYAAGRLAKSFEKLATYYENLGDWKEVAHLKSRAERIREEFMISGAVLDDFPTVADAAATLAGFAMDDRPKTRKLLVTRRDNDEVITVIFARSRVESDDAAVVSPPDETRSIWHIPAWGMTVEFVKSTPESGTARISAGGVSVTRIL